MNHSATTEDEVFYQNLLKKIEAVYVESSVYKLNLFYSLAALPISKGEGLILGINWGGSGDGFSAQTDMPKWEKFVAEFPDSKDYSFLKKSAVLLNEFFQIDVSKGEYNYANFCFFRTPREKDLSLQDYQLCLPILKEYIEYIQPKWILCMGVAIIDRFKTLKHPTIQTIIEFTDHTGKFKSYKGTLYGYPFICVEHPKSRKISNISRRETWQKATDNL